MAVARNEPNDALYRNWSAVFRRIPGFERAVCLRRARCPTGSLDPDFLLLAPGAQPALGIVECEGVRTGRRPMRAPTGVEQLIRYLARFQQHAGDGRRLHDVTVRDAFDRRKARGRGNLEVWGSLGRFRAEAGCADEAAFEALLGRASQRLVPILLYYREGSLEPDEYAVLALALRDTPLFAGAVAWPTADRLADAGRFV